MHSTPMKRQRPEDLGFSPAGIINAVHAFEMTGYETHSLLLCSGDGIFFEGHYQPYDGRQPHLLHSLTKVFTNIAVGLLVQDGRLSLEDRIVDFFPEYVPSNPDPRLLRMTVRHLITMRNGHGRMISGNEWRPIHTSWIARFFDEPMVHEPGEVFQYSSGNSYILSAIIQRITEETTESFLRRRVFKPLGIVDYTWDSSPDGINPGGNGLSMRPEDLAKIGSLFLNGGCWNGRTLIDPDWIRLCLGERDRLPLPDGRSYGFHWWDIGFGYYAGGAFGQIICLFPSLDIVAVMTAGTQIESEKALKVLYEALQKELAVSPCEEPSDAPDLYEHWQCSRNLLPRLDTQDCPALEGRYRMNANPYGITEVSLQTDDKVLIFSLTDQSGEHRIRCGIGWYEVGVTDMPGASLHHQYDFGNTPCWAGACMDLGGSILMQWFFPETPFHDWVRIHLSDQKITVIRGTNVNSGVTVMPELTGTQYDHG